jgi:hypothetical protein
MKFRRMRLTWVSVTRMWWQTPVSLILEGLRQEDCKLREFWTTKQYPVTTK